MNWVGVFTALGVVASVVGILGWFGLSVDGRRVAGRITEWFQRPRKEREARIKEVADLRAQLNEVNDLVVRQSATFMSNHVATQEELRLFKARVDGYEKMLGEARNQIADLRRVVADQENRLVHLETTPTDRVQPPHRGNPPRLPLPEVDATRAREISKSVSDLLRQYGQDDS